MYLIVYGEISIFNKSNNSFLKYPSSTIIGDWPFITNTLSEFKYVVNEKKFAVGFVLDLNFFKEISERNISSSQEFFIISQRKIQFIRKMNNTINFDLRLIRDERKRNTISNFVNIQNEQENENIELKFDKIQNIENKTVIKSIYDPKSKKFEMNKNISNYKVI